MTETIEQALALEGLDCFKTLLDLERRRFQESVFLKDSTFEQINAAFGIFPTTPAFPVYFSGDISKPRGKITIVGINPLYDQRYPDRQRKEFDYLQNNDLFNGYCRIYSDFFDVATDGKLTKYYQCLVRFLNSYLEDEEPKGWKWLQDHVVHLDLVPYHSSNANGLRINDPKKYRDTFFEVILRMIKHINPETPIFFNGLGLFKELLTADRSKHYFNDVVTFEERKPILVGKICERFDYVALPSLSRPRVGSKELACLARNYQKELRASR